MFEGSRRTLEEVAAHTSCMAHWEKFRSVKLHYRGASRRRGAQSLQASFLPLRSSNSQFLLLQVSSRALLVNLTCVGCCLEGRI